MTHDHTVAPSPWIIRFAPLIRVGGPVLDVACGAGRHSQLFTQSGHPVTALDQDTSLIHPNPHITAIKADLENGNPWPLPNHTFAGIVVTNYLCRPIFPALIQALEPGGIFLYETFAAGNEAFGRPRNPDFLLARGELLNQTQGLTVIAYEDGIVAQEKVVQRICAMKSDGPGIIPL